MEAKQLESIPPLTALLAVLAEWHLDVHHPEVIAALRRWLGYEADCINRTRSKEDLRLIRGSIEAVDLTMPELLASVWQSADTILETGKERLELLLRPSASVLRDETVLALDTLFSGVWRCLLLGFAVRAELLQRSRAWRLLRFYFETKIEVAVKLDPVLEGLDWYPILTDFLEKSAIKFATGELRGPALQDINYLSCALFHGKPAKQIPSVLVKAAWKKRNRETSLEVGDESGRLREPRQPERVWPVVEVEGIIQWDERLAELAASASTLAPRLALKTLRFYPRLRIAEEAGGAGLVGQVYAWLERINQAGENEALREQLLDAALTALPLRGPGLPTELDAVDMKLASRSRRGYEFFSLTSRIFIRVQDMQQNSAKKRLDRLMLSLRPVLLGTRVDPFQLQAWIMEKDDPDLAALVDAALHSDEEPQQYRDAVMEYGPRIEEWMDRLLSWSSTPPCWMWKILKIAKQNFTHE